MNRRSFFATFAAATAGFTILPAATTYTRLWKAVKTTKDIQLTVNPEWVNAPYEIKYMWMLLGPPISIPMPCRFNQPPPDDVTWVKDHKAFEWVQKNSISPFKIVES